MDGARMDRAKWRAEIDGEVMESETYDKLAGLFDERVWSPYQRAIFAHVEGDPRHLVVEAVAGSGKSTTIVEAIQYATHRRRKVVAAFNRSIAKELEQKSRGRFEAKTLHALGMAACRRAFGDFTVSETKDRDIAEAVCREAGFIYKTRSGEERGLGAGKVARLAGLAKNTLTPEDDTGRLEDLAIDYDLDEEGQLKGRLPELASLAMQRASADTSTLSFDDMVWFPARHNLRPASHDLVVVDETQDMNAAQLYLAEATCRRGGQIVCVGDRRQAIYGFRGADSRAMDSIKQRLHAHELALSISYRCPRSVARLAQEIVPHFQCAADAPEGSVLSGLPEAELYKAEPGDLVVSRKKAPLLALALRLAKAGTPVAILGRDIGKRIADQVESSQASDLPGLVAWARARVAQVRELHGEDRPEKVEQAEDEAAMFEVLAEGSASIAELVAKIDRLFRDGTDARAVVLLSTVHKAKGLERDRVWMIGDTFRVWAGPQWEEDRNIYYVAVTRARRDLRIIGEVRR